MSERTCSVNGCSTKVHAKGWCRKHYTRWTRHGDPLTVRLDDPLGRILARSDRSGDCWIWTGRTDSSGYAVMRVDGNNSALVHRLSYELNVGPIPTGLTIDHLCRVRHCVNPQHLQPVTNHVNVLRGIGPTAVNARKTECIHGHPFDAENTIWVTSPYGHTNRKCRACRNERNRRRSQAA